MAKNQRGFTIVDVLALGTITIAAAAIVQPVLEDAKTQSMATSNRSQHRMLSAQQGMFIAANDGQFASANVTGWLSTPGPDQDPGMFTGDTSASTPTQATDWITPLLGESLGWSNNRALRTQQLLEQVRDPRNARFNDSLFGTADDLDDYIAAAQLGGFFSVSYLAPAAFQFWGTPEPGGFIPGQGTVKGDIEIWQNKFGGVPYNFGGTTAANINTPREYRPRIENVGSSLSQKVMFADGTRYVALSGITDIELNPTPGVFGNFVSGFFGSEFENSYGRNRPGIYASARRGGLSNDVDDRVLFVSFFDGSTRPVSVTNAKARPDWWAPSGSEWVSLDSVAAEASAQYEVGDLLP
jgi:type II secretory pathway pseudopilin PulG